jgi:hypothetical protein
MIHRSELKEVQQRNQQLKPKIEDSLKGVDFDYFFTGKRMGTGGEIELHITSVVTDWATNTYTRKSIYRGHKGRWKECIEQHILSHLKDLNSDLGIVKAMMRYFEVDRGKFKSWERHHSL